MIENSIIIKFASRYACVDLPPSWFGDQSSASASVPPLTVYFDLRCQIGNPVRTGAAFLIGPPYFLSATLIPGCDTAAAQNRPTCVRLPQSAPSREQPPCPT